MSMKYILLGTLFILLSYVFIHNREIVCPLSFPSVTFHLNTVRCSGWFIFLKCQYPGCVSWLCVFSRWAGTGNNENWVSVWDTLATEFHGVFSLIKKTQNFIHTFYLLMALKSPFIFKHLSSFYCYPFWFLFFFDGNWNFFSICYFPLVHWD